jgi:hypothetical protein
MKKENVLIFLRPFTIKNPTVDEQNAFMGREIVNEVECADLGEIYSNEVLYDKDLNVFIRNEVKRKHPEWIVAEGASATAAFGIRHQKKILINPNVSYDELNNVSEFDRQKTFAFFDSCHEQDYEHFQSAYLNSALFPDDDNLTLFTIKEMVESIIETEEW